MHAYFVALFQLFEHPHILVCGNIITRRLVPYLLLYYHVFMLIYYIKYPHWIVDYRNYYFLSTFLFYSRHAAIIKDISTYV